MLPDDRREALIMRFALGMDNREIARALGRSDGATKVLIHRAIKQLEEIVGERDGRRGRTARGDRERPMTEAAPTSRACCAKRSRRSSRPTDLAVRLEGTLTSITEMAADELEAWELSAMRDPRNWVRPAAALVAGGAAGAALVLLRARRRAQLAAPPRGIAGVRDGRRAHAARSRARDAQAARRPLSAAAARGRPERGGRS